MLKQLRIIGTGIFVSFIGALPLGTQNIAAAQIAISDGVEAALLFSVGLILADVFYIYLTLMAMRWIHTKKRLFKALEWVTLLIVFSLAASNFYAALHPTIHKNVLLSNGLPRLLLGVALNGLNPVQIPFWLGWTTVLLTKKVLQPRWADYHFFVGGASVGFFAALLLFIFGGRLIADAISTHQNLLYYTIGGIFTVTGLVQVWKMWRKKDAVEMMEGEEIGVVVIPTKEGSDWL